MHILVISKILVKHLSSLMTTLRCFHKIQSSPEVDKLLYLIIALLNSSLEKKGYLHICFNGSSFRRLGLI